LQRVTAISAALIPEGTRAVVLAGGIGARLRPYTTVLPKPLMPIGERPILAIVLEHLRESGVRRVTLSVGHLAELMMAYAGRGGTLGPGHRLRARGDNRSVRSGLSR
jgi:NDP-sugar pyrophosphorylase family protein